MQQATCCHGWLRENILVAALSCCTLKVRKKFLLSINVNKQHCHNLPDEEHHLPGSVVAPEIVLMNHQAAPQLEAADCPHAECPRAEPSEAESAEAMSFAAANCPGAETGQAESLETELPAESEKAEPGGTDPTQQKPPYGAQSQSVESPEAELLLRQPSRRLALQQLLARGCHPVLAALLGVHPVQLGCCCWHLSWS